MVAADPKPRGFGLRTPEERKILARAAADRRWGIVRDDAGNIIRRTTTDTVRRSGTAKARQAFAEKIAADPDYMADLAALSVRSRRRRWVASTADDTVRPAA